MQLNHILELPIVYLEERFESLFQYNIVKNEESSLVFTSLSQIKHNKRYISLTGVT